MSRCVISILPTALAPDPTNEWDNGREHHLNDHSIYCDPVTSYSLNCLNHNLLRQWISAKPLPELILVIC